MKGIIRNDTNLTREEALEKVKGSPRIKVGELHLRVEAATLDDARQIWAGMIADPDFDHMSYRGDVVDRHSRNSVRLNKLVARGRIGPKSFMDQVQGDAVFLFVSSN